MRLCLAKRDSWMDGVVVVLARRVVLRNVAALARDTNLGTMCW